MIWVTWRQHRAEATIVGAAFAVLAALLLIIGHDMASQYHQLGIPACIAHPEQNASCPDIVGSFRDQFATFIGAITWLNLFPVLLAMLVGAPLVAREFENGTHRLAWTQSITRMRWLVVKLALIFGASLTCAGLLSLLLTWFRGPFDILQGRMRTTGFDLEGTVMVAYMAYAMALAVAAGAVLRRAIPAMVVTLAGYLAVRLPIDFWARAHYAPPLVTNAFTPSYSHLDWTIGEYWADSAGRHISDNQAFSTCATPGTLKPDFFKCIQTHGWHETIIYQPASRFWLFQGIETAIFVALAVALVGFTIWLVRRRA